MSATTGKCPQCKQPTVPDYRPFCSKRCADIDLGRWLTGSYVIAGANADDDEDGNADPSSLPRDATAQSVED